MSTESYITYALTAVLIAFSAAPTAQTLGGNRTADQLPELRCGDVDCVLVDATASAQRISAQVANPDPITAGPPPGQRMRWDAAGGGACQSLGTGVVSNPGVPPMYSVTSPYEYIKATEIPVPLGSTHASILSSVQARLSARAAEGHKAGALSIGAIMDMKRSSAPDTAGNWRILDSGYVYVILAFPNDPQRTYNQQTYNKTAFQGFADLGALPGGSGVPSAIDVRLKTFNVITNEVLYLDWNHICNGFLDLTF